MYKKQLTLGSLFDGSGGFPLGGLLCGIKPVWASEIEPFPIRVTTKRLPEMKHYGDISKLNGADLEPVDIITFGSPCQDMSHAGRRVGIQGSRSSLFFEAIRIIKEMRKATNGKYPRYIVWENVSGARSSNKGKDFQEVLRQICSIKEEDVSIPEPEKGKWLSAGNIVGDSFSVAWRLLDAQYWGVPQRRKRIYLVADFASGDGAREVLFKSEGLSRYSPESFKVWQETTRDPASGAGSPSGICLNDQGGSYIDVSNEIVSTLRAESHRHESIVLHEITDDDTEPKYVVRKLSPVECARLQGFPDWWCSDLGTENPTEEEIECWKEVYKDHVQALGKTTKPKTSYQIRKWLQDPYRDNAAYKMWGNGVALPCVYFVMAGIEYVNGLSLDQLNQ